jgi:hypothetical protein
MKKAIDTCSEVVTISEDMKGQIEAVYGYERVRLINNWAIGDLFPMDNSALKVWAMLCLAVMYLRIS